MGKKNLVENEESLAEVVIDESMSEGAGAPEVKGDGSGSDGGATGGGSGAAGGSSADGAAGGSGADGNGGDGAAAGVAGDGSAGAAGNGGLVVPKVEGMAGPNHYSGSAGKSATVTEGESTRESESSGSSRVRVDEETYQELKKKHFDDLMGRTRASIINELFAEDLDPAKAEREKADADRRRRRHEGVEAVRLLIEGFTGAAHGRIIKRDKANYQRYQDEKDKVDATRKAALEKLYAAMAADDEMARNIKLKLMELAKVSEQEQVSKGKESKKGRSETDQNSLSAGYTPRESAGGSGSGDGSGKGGGDDYTLTYQEVGEDNKGTGRRVVVRFGGEKAYKSYMSEAANVITQSANISKADDIKEYKGEDGKIHKVKRGIDEDTLLYRCMQIAVKNSGISKNQKEAAQQVSDILLNGYYVPEGGETAVPAWKLREQMIRSVTNQNQAMRDLLSRYSGTDGTNIAYYKSADSTPIDTYTVVEKGKGNDLK